MIWYVQKRKLQWKKDQLIIKFKNKPVIIVQLQAVKIASFYDEVQLDWIVASVKLKFS